MIGKDLEVLVKGIVKKVCYEYEGFNLDREDLISEGYLLAVVGSKKYDKSFGASLGTYLYGQVAFRLRNYVGRKVLKATHGTEALTRVSMELVDQEVSTSLSLETKMDLDEFRISLGAEERIVFDALRQGYTYREISIEMSISTWTITQMVKRWRQMNEV